MKKILLSLSLFAALSVAAQEGGISTQMLQQIKTTGALKTPADKAMRNALNATAMRDLARTADNADARDTEFSHRVHSVGITNQESSGRCWLFSSLNVMRARIIQQYNMGGFQFSPAYSFFYDQLEKSNLFLQAVIDNAKKPMDDRQNEWLFKNVLSDGGTFAGAQDIITKYGLVPAEVMPESYNANNTSRMSEMLQLKLREFGLALRKDVAQGKSKKQLEAHKTEMLGTVYHILALCLGEPPTEFTWTLKDRSGKAISTETYTPRSFYDRFVGENLVTDYVLLMNDPTRPYHKAYTIDMDRHMYDGHNWTFLNLPIEDIKAAAIASIKDSTMMYFSCDVGKLYDSKTGVSSLKNFDYESILGTSFSMDKADRIRTFASGSTHAMTLMAVDLDANGKPKKWMVENSWGANSGFQGHIVMTDEWFDNYMFRLVVRKKYVPTETLRLLDTKPVQLPAWDPLFAPEQ